MKQTFTFFCSRALPLTAAVTFGCLVLLGVGFSGKRNSFGVYLSDHINSQDLPKRMNGAFQGQIISDFLDSFFELKMLKGTSPQLLLKQDEDCGLLYRYRFRKNSNTMFFLPKSFNYTFGDILINNNERPGLIFLEIDTEGKNQVYVEKCFDDWLVSFVYD